MARPKKIETNLEILNKVKAILFSNVVSVEEIEKWGYKFDKDKTHIIGSDYTKKTTEEAEKTEEITEEEAQKKLQKIRENFDKSKRLSLEDLKKDGFDITLNSDGSIKSITRTK